MVTKIRELKAADRNRILCQHEGCNRQADVAQQDEWNTGNTSGMSFWYFCKEHNV